LAPPRGCAGALIGAAVQKIKSRVTVATARRLSTTLGRNARFHYSPYTGRVHDLRSAACGLTRDVDTGRLFRKPN
jgi:hypothetical protein